MIKGKKAKWIRKSHRYLGIFLGLQFLMWTISGLYFSWTNIDDIHGDQFRKTGVVATSFSNLLSPSALSPSLAIASIDLREIKNEPYYWINKKQLFHARTGDLKKGVSKEEAIAIANKNIVSGITVKDIQLINSVGKHHEYREKLLPAYVISYNEPNNLKVYVSVNDGAFQTVRHRDWRWFDFLWMTHTMDYEGRDNMNNIVLRIFSVLGLITVLSGFLLWFITSPTIRKIKRKMKRSIIK
ncbi:PepSY domain-containing protein [Flavobacterium sp. K5-23]|uniref:PepSY domain-containing protein n=1 Tax=Flavobacterium sp. K5-23 TaxID=2746225 RepID=UPI00200F802C|nr:PepSY domain-containing protein [Flavobacterium sp. K5-23]UQD55146.1 PepSY domain-containing protein [Flavobacterium sp. K5-23]